MRETLVSCFFNLQREEKNQRKDLSFYMNQASFLLSQKIPMVLFLDKDVAVECNLLRKSLQLEDITRIVPTDIQDMPYYECLEEIKEARKVNPLRNGDDQKKDTALFTALTWAKFAFIKQAMDMNPFKSTHFAWCDFGIAHVAKTTFAAEAFSDFPDRIKMLTLRNILPRDLSPNNQKFGKTEFVKKHYYAFERGIVAAGYMTGGKKEWELLFTLFNKEVRSLLKEKFAPSEQQILPYLMITNPSLFISYRGDYDAILSNYRHFRISLRNLTEYTLRRAKREGVDLRYSCTTGVEIFKMIERGDYDPNQTEDPAELLDFLNELYASLVQISRFELAEKIRVFYRGIRSVARYQIQVTEYIPE